MLLNAVKEQLSFIHPCIHPSVESAECMYIYIYTYILTVFCDTEKDRCVHRLIGCGCTRPRGLFVVCGALLPRVHSTCVVLVCFATRAESMQAHCVLLPRAPEHLWIETCFFINLSYPFLSKIVILNCSNPFVALICTGKILPLLTLLNFVAILMVPSAQALGMVNWVPLGLKVHSSDPGDAI